MNNETIKKSISWIVFFIVGLCIFANINDLFLEKSAYAKWRNWNNQENVDILILGNSHADGGIAPDQMEKAFFEEYGKEISVFNASVRGLQIEQTYFFAKELLKTQTPDVVVLETYVFLPLTESRREVLARRAFDCLPLSKNKIEAINFCIYEDRWSHYIPFLKYHTRWKELTENDFLLVYNEESWKKRGKIAGAGSEVMENPGDGWFQQEIEEDIGTQELYQDQRECLGNLIDLLEEKDIELLFVTVPFKRQMGLDSIGMMKINNYLLENYVNDDNIRLLDVNRLWSELDFDYDDLNNAGHVNVSGAKKTTDCLIRYMDEQYDIPDMAG